MHKKRTATIAPTRMIRTAANPMMLVISVSPSEGATGPDVGAAISVVVIIREWECLRETNTS